MTDKPKDEQAGVKPSAAQEREDIESFRNRRPRTVTRPPNKIVTGGSTRGYETK